MGIFSFRKKNKSKKRLKELTGGFTLSFEFMDYIKSVNLTISDGVSIKDQLNDEIDEYKLSPEEVETRLHELVYIYMKDSQKQELSKSELLKLVDDKRTYNNLYNMAFLLGIEEYWSDIRRNLVNSIHNNSVSSYFTLLTLFESSVLSISDESIDFSKICQSGIIVSILKNYIKKINKDNNLDHINWINLSESFLKKQRQNEFSFKDIELLLNNILNWKFMEKLTFSPLAENFNFRDFDGSFVVFKDEKLAKSYSYINKNESDVPNSLLTYSFITHEKGIGICIIATASMDEDFNIFERDNFDTYLISPIHEYFKIPCGLYTRLVDMPHVKDYISNIKTDTTRDLEKFRSIHEIDYMRFKGFPDDIQVLFLNENGANEFMWVRAEYLKDNNFYGTLLNTPYADFGVESGDIVKIDLIEIEKEKIIAIADLSNEKTKKQPDYSIEDFNKIMTEIVDSLTGNPIVDKKLLVKYLHTYKKHPLSTELIREISKLLYATLNEVEQKSYEKVCDEENPLKDGLDEIKNSLDEKDYKTAINKAEVLHQNIYLEFKDDKTHEYHYFGNIIEETIFKKGFTPKKQLVMVPDYMDLLSYYYIYGFLLNHVGRHKNAEMILKIALNYNPVSLPVLLELCEVYKLKENLSNLKETIDESFKYVYLKKDIAKLYRNLGYYYGKTSRYDLSFAAYTLSLEFEWNIPVNAELTALSKKTNKIDLIKSINLLRQEDIPISFNSEVISIVKNLAEEAENNNLPEISSYLFNIYNEMTLNNEEKKSSDDPTKNNLFDRELLSFAHENTLDLPIERKKVSKSKKTQNNIIDDYLGGNVLNDNFINLLDSVELSVDAGLEIKKDLKSIFGNYKSDMKEFEKEFIFLINRYILINNSEKDSKQLTKEELKEKLNECYYKLLYFSKEDEWKTIESNLSKKIENDEIKSFNILTREFHNLKHLNPNKTMKFNVIYKQILTIISKYPPVDNKNKIIKDLIIFSRDKTIFDFKLLEIQFNSLIYI